MAQRLATPLSGRSYPHRSLDGTRPGRISNTRNYRSPMDSLAQVRVGKP
ncbi:MAG: hypothetical protein WCA35_21535 [Kovacikia sp.]